MLQTKFQYDVTQKRKELMGWLTIYSINKKQHSTKIFQRMENLSDKWIIPEELNTISLSL